MASKLSSGCRVAAKATLFDKKGDPRWSESVFGSTWRTATCIGTVLNVLRNGKSVSVQWDVDGSVTPIQSPYLSLLEQSSDDRSNESDGGEDVDVSESESEISLSTSESIILLQELWARLCALRSNHWSLVLPEAHFEQEVAS